jgi:hypothetical protein
MATTITIKTAKDGGKILCKNQKQKDVSKEYVKLSPKADQLLSDIARATFL